MTLASWATYFLCNRPAWVLAAQGLLNSLLPILRNPSQGASIDSEKLPEQYFETWSAQKTGITWKHDNAISAIRYLPESMGPGVAMFDYDNDGWMDLYFVNSGPVFLAC